MRQHNPPHPGLVVHEFCMKPRGLNVSETAKILGVSRQRLSEIVRCKARLTPDDAIRIEKAFGYGAGMMYRVQSIYDLAQVRQNGAAEAIAKSMPVRQVRVSRV